MRPADDVKRMIKNLNDKTSAKMDERVLGDVLHALDESEKMPAPIRRTIMRSPITKLAAAAGIILAVIIIINQFGGPVDVNIASSAFAAIVEEISNARTVIYQQTFYPGEEREFTTTEMVNEMGIKRSEMSHGDIMIFDFNSGKNLHLMPNSKRAILTQRVGRPRRNKLYIHLSWLNMILEIIKSAEELEDYTLDENGNYIVDDGVWFVGQEEVDGKMANVFILKKPFDQTTVWIDPDTNLPVLVEEINWPHPNKDIIAPYMALSIRDFGGETYEMRSIGISNSGGIQKEMTIVKSDFVWNTELDESLFSLEPPEGYTAEERQFDVSKSDENTLIEALSFWTEMSGGTFPSKINDLGDPNMVKPMLIAKFDKDGDPKEELDQAMKQLHIVLKGLYFAQELKINNSWHYTGDGVTLGDSDRPVCRWKSKDSDNYSVIYGDLSLGNMSAEELSNFP